MPYALRRRESTVSYNGDLDNSQEIEAFQVRPSPTADISRRLSNVNLQTPKTAPNPSRKIATRSRSRQNSGSSISTPVKPHTEKRISTRPRKSLAKQFAESVTLPEIKEVKARSKGRRILGEVQLNEVLGPSMKCSTPVTRSMSVNFNEFKITEQIDVKLDFKDSTSPEVQENPEKLEFF